MVPRDPSPIADALICSSLNSLGFGNHEEWKEPCPDANSRVYPEVTALPKTCVSVKNDKATIKLALQLAVVPTLIARPRIRNG